MSINRAAIVSYIAAEFRAYAAIYAEHPTSENFAIVSRDAAALYTVQSFTADDFNQLANVPMVTIIDTVHRISEERAKRAVYETEQLRRSAGISHPPPATAGYNQESGRGLRKVADETPPIRDYADTQTRPVIPRKGEPAKPWHDKHEPGPDLPKAAERVDSPLIGKPPAPKHFD